MYLELAQKYLMKARSVSGNTRKYFANLCQVCLAKQGASPADIGTTEQELAMLQSANTTRRIRRDKEKEATKKNKDEDRLKKQIDTCKKYLEQCRGAHGASRQYYANLCSSTIAKYGLTYEQVGTSEEELKDFQKKGLLESAVNYLKEARTATGTKRKCYADLCSEFLLKAQATPEDIGSSKEELAQIGS